MVEGKAVAVVVKVGVDNVGMKNATSPNPISYLWWH
jgi:hypothetical protein